MSICLFDVHPVRKRGIGTPLAMIKFIGWALFGIAIAYLLAVIIGKNTALYQKLANYIGQIGSNVSLKTPSLTSQTDPAYYPLAEDYFTLYCTKNSALYGSQTDTSYLSTYGPQCKQIQDYLTSLGLFSPSWSQSNVTTN